eukprot:6742842-Alexandrium_andersonii.AAC.1
MALRSIAWASSAWPMESKAFRTSRAMIAHGCRHSWLFCKTCRMTSAQSRVCLPGRKPRTP